MDNIDLVIFVVNLDGYDWLIYENLHDQPYRLQEDLKLWREEVFTKKLEKCHFLLVFNFRDLFEEKIIEGKTHLSLSFPEFSLAEKQFPHTELSLLLEKELFIPKVLIPLIFEYMNLTVECTIDWIKQKFLSAPLTSEIRSRVSTAVISAVNEEEVCTMFSTIPNILHKS